MTQRYGIDTSILVRLVTREPEAKGGRGIRGRAFDGSSLRLYHFGKEAGMIVKITAKRQVTFPARVLDAMGVGPGDSLELEEGPDGFILRPRRIDRTRLAPLKDKIPPGYPPFDIRKFREEGYDPALRD